MTPANATVTALIVEHIGDLEPAMRHIGEEIDPTLWEAAETVFGETAAEHGWKSTCRCD